MKICHMIVLVAAGLGAAKVEAQALPQVMVASGASPASMFAERPGRAIRPIAKETPPSAGTLTRKQRLLLFGDDTYASPAAYAGVGFGSMIDQFRHTPSQWDRDGNAYGRRFASEWGQLAVRNGIHEGLAGITGLDPRYLPCTCKGVLHRSLHAIEFSVTTYRQGGGLALDLSQLAGAYGSGILSSYWYPHTHADVVRQGVQFGHEQVGEIAINHLVLEFSADIERALHLPRWMAHRQEIPGDD